MGELQALWPSAPLTLFARFGVGGRDKLGFRPQQRLRQVLARHLLFDVGAVLQRLREAEEAQCGFRVPAVQFASSPGRLVDCRSAQEFAVGTLPGASLLDAALVAQVKGQAVRLFDQSGPMAGAAAVHLAQLGCSPLVLEGGLAAWCAYVDPTFPLLGQGACRILADWHQARFNCEPVTLALEGDPSAVPFECVRLWRHRDYLAVLRSGYEDWPKVSRQVHDWLGSDHPWRPQLRYDWTDPLRKVIHDEVQPTLKSHKGGAELVEVRDGVARVRLGGGCQGCSSAGITVGQEIAAALWRAVPELEGVEDASAHEDPLAQPHH